MRFPEAIPLKRVDADSVGQAMLNFSGSWDTASNFNRSGFSFYGKIVHSLCRELDIDSIRIFPYHSQSDGSLDRWHACLKGMLKHAEIQVKEWDRFLGYILFTNRTTPHCVTGFTPFELVLGRNVKNPLDFLRDSCLSSESEVINLPEWLTSIKTRMKEISEIVYEQYVKQAMKHIMISPPKKRS